MLVKILGSQESLRTLNLYTLYVFGSFKQVNTNIQLWNLNLHDMPPHIIPPFLEAHLSIRASESPAHERHFEAESSPLARAPVILMETGLR